MTPYTVQFQKKEVVAEGTTAFFFTKPAEFKFKAGQSMDLTLMNSPETDAEGNPRAFSIASPPYETELMIVTRMRDTAFKRVLKSLPEKTELKMEGPFGSMTLHNDTARPAVILAGGIGITPFLSMVRQATHEKLPHNIFLFYSNRRPEDAAFLNELRSLENDNPHYKFIGTMTEIEKSKMSWEGERGYITTAMILRYLPELTTPIYYTAGPPTMVLGMREMLNAAGVDDDYIRSEEFAGY